MVIQSLDDAVPLAKALVAAALKCWKSPCEPPSHWMPSDSSARKSRMRFVGAGTITTPEQLKAAEEAGAVFAISPGLTPTLLDAAKAGKHCLDSRHINPVGTHDGHGVWPGSFQIFSGRSRRRHTDAEIHRRPDSSSDFLPDRWISPENYNAYLNLSNVACVGGSWLVPADL